MEFIKNCLCRVDGFTLQILLVLLVFVSTFSNAQVLTNIESVEYDPSQDRFFISNSSSIIAMASDGQLSFFAAGSGASAGMEVLGNHLFVIDGTTIRGFELDTENEVMTLNLPDALFLNGLTNDGDSMLYATDFSANRIHKINVDDLDNPVEEVIVANTVTTPNGIVYDGVNNRLLFVNWESNARIKAVDLTDNSVSTIYNTNLESIDGIDEDIEGNYYLSSWQPARITKFDKNFQGLPEIITTPFLNSPADICFAREINTLAIPHNGNEVLLVEIPFDSITTNTLDLSLGDIQLNVFPNPVSDHSVLQFELFQEQRLIINITDVNGRIVRNILNGRQPIGKHQVLLTGLFIPSGAYWLTVESEGENNSIALKIE